MQQALEGHSDWVMSVAFSPDGSRLASGSWDTTVKVWDAATGTLQQTLEGHSDPVMSVAFSYDGTSITTNIGELRLDAQGPPQAELASQHIHRQKIRLDGGWIQIDDQRYLWLPSDYRPRDSDSYGQQLALGLGNGQVCIYEFGLTDT